MLIAIGCDHTALDFKSEIMAYLEELGHTVTDIGVFSSEAFDYPLIAEKVAVEVVSGKCERGIVICGTGIGVSISANKVRGIRCACCADCYSAVLSRQHNDANMLALGSRVTGAEAAKMIAKLWLEAEFMGGRHSGRVALIHEIENRQ